MVIKVNKTYRGKHGLFVQGHLYDLTQGQIAAISSELEEQRQKFEYEKVKDPAHFNRPPREQKEQDTPKNKQTTGGKTK
jgi:hypothetical protein